MIAILIALLLGEVHAESQVFKETTRAYFRMSEVCWGIKNTPSRKVVEEEIRAIEYSSTRFWPECPDEARDTIFVLMLSETQGRNGVAKKDPVEISYGVLCCRYRESKLVGKMYDLPKSKRDGKWFKNTLTWQPDIAVLYGAAWLRTCYDRAGGDWIRTILLYKHGDAGLRRAMNGLKDRPLTSLKAWRRFDHLRRIVQCVQDRMVLAGEGCQPCATLNAKKTGGK